MIMVAIKNKTYTGVKKGLFSRKVEVKPYLRIGDTDYKNSVQVISDANLLSYDKNIILFRAGHKDREDIASRYEKLDIANADVFFNIMDMNKLLNSKYLELLVMTIKKKEQALNGYIEIAVIDTDKEEVLCRERADAANNMVDQQVGYRVFLDRKGDGLNISGISVTASHKASDCIKWFINSIDR